MNPFLNIDSISLKQNTLVQQSCCGERTGNGLSPVGPEDGPRQKVGG